MMENLSKTLEEKANKYARNYVDDDSKIGSIAMLSDAYIAGAKENGVVWHDLRKNPMDLPTCGNWILCYMNESYHDRYIVGMTDEINDNEPFLVGYETDETNGFENVIAWQYLPEPPKEA